jgi:quinol monooxygenase YgiN
MKVTEISPEHQYLTLINIFTVAPANQQQLVDLLIAATEGSITTIAGFISSSLHRSLDGAKVTMYSQWQSLADYQNMRSNPAASPYLEQALKIATFESAMYEVVRTFIQLL